MRNCDTCGGPIDPAHPFRVCPECLFKEALSAAPDDAPAPAAASADSGGVVSRFVVRGDFLERYEFLEYIGHGGQGDIWKVWDFEFRRVVAMKCLAAEALTSDAAVYRFIAEAQIAGQLEHPGVLPIFDAGLDPDGKPFYTTQLLPGTTFGDIWRQAVDPAIPEWTVNRALELLLKVCDVMGHAHSRHVIHRDLKPPNVLVGAFGDVRVIDWGSAHVLKNGRKNFGEPFTPVNQGPIQSDREDAVGGDAQSIYATAKSGLSMTILFTAPELLRGELDQIGPRTDIYSVGVMLHELVGGRSPYCRPGGDFPEPAELKKLIIARPPPRLRSLNPLINRDLAAICEKAMAFDIADRYPTMKELGDDIRAALECRPVKARKPGPWLKLQKWAQRNTSLVLAAGAVVVVSSGAFFIIRGAHAQRDGARRTAALRNADLAAQRGRWRLSLQYLGEAEAAGYHDEIDLHLRRAEALTVLNEPKLSQIQLSRLLNRPDLGDHRGVVLLRMGEHELFDLDFPDRGVRHIREALAAGLPADEKAFANGLLAESTLEAVDLFREVLVGNPYHHGAHVHTLGLEFLLGRHEEFKNESHIFKTLYPEDPSPAFLEATELAMAGRLREARARLESVAGSVSPEMLTRLESSCRGMAVVAKRFEVDTLLNSSPTNLDTALAGLASVFFASDLPGSSNENGVIRIPQLPCVKKGMLEGYAGVRNLAIPLLSDPKTAVPKVKAGWRRHREALMPALAGVLLSQFHPRSGAKSIPLLSMQAELFQMAADSTSILPGLPGLALYLAARTQFDLAAGGRPDSAAAAAACLRNVRRAGAREDCSVAELAAYYDFAFTLHDYDLARELLVKWEHYQPGDTLVLRQRVELELAVGATGKALEAIDRLLIKNPADSWALEHRRAALGSLKAMSEAFPHP